MLKERTGTCDSKSDSEPEVGPKADAPSESEAESPSVCSSVIWAHERATYITRGVCDAVGGQRIMILHCVQRRTNVHAQLKAYMRGFAPTLAATTDTRTLVIAPLLFSTIPLARSLIIAVSQYFSL